MIEKTARLARIRLSSDERVVFAKQLEEVLTLFDELKNVDVTGIEPLRHPFEAATLLRADVPRPEQASLRNYLLQATGVSEDGQYEVVAVL